MKKKIDFAYSAYKDVINDEEKLKKIPTNYRKIVFSEDYLLSLDELNEFRTFAKKIVDCFRLEKVILLANNSIRDYLRIHAEFIKHIILKKKTNTIFDETIAEATDINWRITTEFLSWINKISDPFRLDTFNVLSEAFKFNNTLPDNVGCFLPYVVLTRIWNECVSRIDNPSPDNNPYLKNIIKDICEDFDYKHGEVLETLKRLYQTQGSGRNNFITFRKKKKINLPSDLEGLETTVRITDRGRVIVGSIINSYGYLRHCSIVEFNKSLSVERNIIEQIKEITRIHLTSLQLLRDKKYYDKKGWLEKYLLKYGIPMEKDYVRSLKRGRNISYVEHDRTLYLDTVYYSLAQYFKYRNKANLRSEVLAIEIKFRNYVEKLDLGKIIKTFEI